MPDKRLDEIAERLQYIPSGTYKALDGAKVTLDGQEFLEDCGTLDIAEFIAHAPIDLAYLLTRLRAAEEVAESASELEREIALRAGHQITPRLSAALTTWREARDG